MGMDCGPKSGTTPRAHVWDSGIGTLRRMKQPKAEAQRSRDVLKTNLNALMASPQHKPALGLPRQVVAIGKVTNGTLGRVRNAENGTRLDTLDGIAETFGCEPWQLLVPGMDPAAMPKLVTPGLIAELKSIMSPPAPPPTNVLATQDPTVLVKPIRKIPRRG